MNYTLDCPLPKLDFDVITLGHGSGGALTNKLLDSGVFSLFDNEILNERHDGAILDLQGPLAFSTDSFVVSPVFFPGGNIGSLAVHGTVNDLAMCGAIPKYLSVGFILEEGLKMQEFWEVLVSMKVAAENAGVKIVTGDTKVVERGKGDKIFINTTGIGVIHEKANISLSKVVEGDKIIISGEMAHHGMAIMSEREGLEFDTEIVSDSQSLHKPVLNLIDQFGDQIKLLRDPTRGGLATVLAELSKQLKLGIDIREASFPKNEQVLAACEMLGLDPMYVANEGLFIAIVSSDVADECIDILKKHPETQKTSVIGEITSDHPGQTVSVNPFGGRRVIHMLPGEQLSRIC